MNELVVEYSYTYHRSISKNSIYPDYSALTEEVESSKNPLDPLESELQRIKVFQQMLHQKLVKINICYWFYV